MFGEPENIDLTMPNFIGKQYLQQIVASGELERLCGVKLDPACCRVYLCGNPAMIGALHHAAVAKDSQPVPQSMLAILAERGFQLKPPRRAGQCSL